MPDFEADPGFISEDQGTVYDYEASLGEAVGASFQRQMDTNQFQFVLREGAFLAEDFQSLIGAAERVDQKTAQEEVRKRGLSLDIPAGGITRYELDTLQYLKQREIQQNTTMARRSGALTTVAGLGAGLAAGATDPLNVASAFIPVVPQARYAAWLARAEGVAGRAAIRAGVGATEGAVGAALLEPIVYAGATGEQLDYTGADSFLNVMFGTVLGGGLHVAGGAYADWRAMPVSAALAREGATNAPESVQIDALQTAVQALEDDTPVAVGPVFADHVPDMPSNRPYFDAWHGSPETFSRFDTAKVGVVNGADFGHGIYLTSTSKVADRYRYVGDTDAGGGSVYGVRVFARQDEMLDWDKPLAQQSDTVRAALNKVFGEPAASAIAVQLPSGRWVLQDANNQIIGRKDGWPTRGDALASAKELDAKRPRTFEAMVRDNKTGAMKPGGVELAQKLREAGIKGVTYFHRGFIGDGGGEPNFAIFDPNDLEIISRNGEPIPSASRGLSDLIPKANQERTADAFNRQFVDDPADVEASRQGDEAVAAAKSDDLETVAADTQFLDSQINGLKTREMWTAADDKALEAGEIKAAELEKAASIYRAAAICMAE